MAFVLDFSRVGKPESKASTTRRGRERKGPQASASARSSGARRKHRSKSVDAPYHTARARARPRRVRAVSVVRAGLRKKGNTTVATERWTRNGRRKRGSNGNVKRDYLSFLARSQVKAPRARPAQRAQSSRNSWRVHERMSAYAVGKSIGQGTFGKVYAGKHVLTGVQVAIKVLEKGKIRHIADVERVEREILILKRVSHSNVVRLYEVINCPTAIVLVMDYASEGELFDYIVSQGRVKESEVCVFMHQLLNGLDDCHRRGIVHRDLKPENILLCKSERPLLSQSYTGSPAKVIGCGHTLKIIDFGLGNMAKPHSVMRTACGSPCYAAPEMIEGKPYVGSAADIWSLGVIFYALLCGYLPFEEESTAALYDKIIHGIYDIPDHVSPGASDLLRRLLCTNPRKRYTASQIRAHPWYSSLSFPTDPELISSNAVQDRSLNPAVLKLVESALSHMPRQELLALLMEQPHGQVAATYHMLASIQSPDIQSVQWDISVLSVGGETVIQSPNVTLGKIASPMDASVLARSLSYSAEEDDSLALSGLDNAISVSAVLGNVSGVVDAEARPAEDAKEPHEPLTEMVLLPPLTDILSPTSTNVDDVTSGTEMEPAECAIEPVTVDHGGLRGESASKERGALDVNTVDERTSATEVETVNVKKDADDVRPVDVKKKDVEDAVVDVKEKEVEDAVKPVDVKEKDVEDAVKPVDVKEKEVEDAVVDVKEKDAEDAVKPVDVKEKEVEDAVVDVKEKDVEDAVVDVKKKEVEDAVRPADVRKDMKPESGADQAASAAKVPDVVPEIKADTPIFAPLPPRKDAESNGERTAEVNVGPGKQSRKPKNRRKLRGRALVLARARARKYRVKRDTEKRVQDGPVRAPKPPKKAGSKRTRRRKRSSSKKSVTGKGALVGSRSSGFRRASRVKRPLRERKAVAVGDIGVVGHSPRKPTALTT